MSKFPKGYFTLGLIGLLMAGCGGSGGGDNTPPSYAISGSVTSSGTGLEGVAMLLSGDATASKVSDANGRYTFSGLRAGRYTITPAKQGYADRPWATTQTINGADITNVNFTAVPSSPIFHIVDDQGKLGTVNVETGEVHVIGTTRDETGPIVMTDIAFDANGDLYGISALKLYRIDPVTAAVTPIGLHHLSYATSLVFSNDGAESYTADNTLFAIDTASAKTTLIGSGNDTYYSSGDLTFIGGVLYLTSKTADNPAGDYLVRLDKGKGTVVGPIGYPNVFGTGTNDNVRLYGFSGTKVISINTATGAGTMILDIAGKGLGNINGAAY